MMRCTILNRSRKERIMIKWRFYALLQLACLLPCLAFAAPPKKPVVVSPDEAFMNAREAFRVGNRERLAQSAEQLRGHALEMYGDYWLLLVRRAELEDADYQAFLERNDGSVLAERVRVEWLRQLGKRRAWERFAEVRPKVAYTEDLEVLCLSALARVMRNDEEGFAEAQALWLTPKELPEGCTAMAERLLQINRLLDRHVWERIRQLGDAGLLPAIRRTADYLPDSQALDPKQIESAFNQPAAWLKRGVELRTRPQRELALIAVGRLAKTDAREAADWWKRIGKKPFTESEHQWGWAQIDIWENSRIYSKNVR